MLILMTPAKRLNDVSYTEISSYLPDGGSTQPMFLKQAFELVKAIRKLGVTDLAKVMSVSPKIAELNYERFIDWELDHNQQNSVPAVLLYAGDVYQKLSPKEYSEKQRQHLQSSVRIVSGLYGLLRAYDLMQPYRLEMSTNLTASKHAGLHDYWKQDITKEVKKLAEESGLLVNLLSNEYEQAVDFEQIKTPKLKVIFKQMHKGRLKTIGLLAKKARGMFVDFVVKNSLRDQEDLKGFNTEGYKLQEDGKGYLVFALK